MAFKLHNLSCIGYANGFTLWRYRTADYLAEVTAPNYFQQNHIQTGDFILLQTGDAHAYIAVMGEQPIRTAILGSARIEAANEAEAA